MAEGLQLPGVALVTGAGSGIGEAVALRLARAGARVVVADLDGASAEATAKQIVEAGGDAIALTADISDEDRVQRLVAETVEAYGALDHVANIAGYGPRPSPLLEEATAVLRGVLDVNIAGTWFCTVAAAKHMREHGGGTILNTSSGVGLKATPGTAAYGTSKAAIAHLTKVAAIELAPMGIRVNALSPGPTVTPGFNSLADDVDAWHRRVTQGVPMGRLGRVEDIADAALWLASDAAAFVTGIVLPVDGGETAR